jgi:hypothetical protein
MVLDTITYEEDGSVWNFAYGSNMNAHTLTKRRKIIPLESVPGILNGWKFSFEYRGLPFIEPSFAVVHPGDAKDRCHGVLHKMSKADFINLLRSEGNAGAGYDKEGYKPIEVFVKAYDGRTIRAYALSSTKGALHQGRVSYPSKRYLKICHDGAMSHKVDQEWLDFLATHPYHVPTKTGIVALSVMVVLLLPILLVCGIAHLFYPSRFMHSLFYKISNFLWGIHDWLPASVQGAVEKLLEKSA